MATETTNLHLEKPAENEFYDVKKFNANWDKIDAAVKSLSSAEEYDAAQTYANIVACREGEQQSAKIQALINALQTDAVKDYIDATYSGAVVAIF